MTANQVLESEVRSYSRSFPINLAKARGSRLFTVNGTSYLDFLSGCGSLNYGHNPDPLKSALLDHISRDGLAMSMDMTTVERAQFIEAFDRRILRPRGLSYRLQFPGPTGSNAVEAAIKLARKVTGRTNVISFTNSFHGCSLGALSLTGNRQNRSHSAPLLGSVTRLPYDGYMGNGVNAADLLDRYLGDPGSGCDAPAAIVLEAIQGEGGLNCASESWAQQVSEVAHQHGALLVIDDIQAGCGRSGDFFSFEALGIKPDMVCLAKAISGYGLPMSLLLIAPEHDQWAPGEHNGTFRGNIHACVTARVALETFWADATFEGEVRGKSEVLSHGLEGIAKDYGLERKGRGMMQGLSFDNPAEAARVQAGCFSRRLIVERCGPHDEVLKLLPPLTVSHAELEEGLGIIRAALSRGVEGSGSSFAAALPEQKALQQ